MIDFEVDLHTGESFMRACRLSKSLVVHCTPHARTRVRFCEMLPRSYGQICGRRRLVLGGDHGKWPQFQKAQLVHA